MPRDYSRLERTAFARHRLESLRLLVVGAGALGNEVLKNLALLGAGHIDILDRDRIEPSNLTRSILFCSTTVDQDLARRTPKAELASARVREINPDVTVTPHVGEIADLGAGILRRADLIFSCLDNEMARLELSWACTRVDRPLVDGGLGLSNPSSGLVSLFPGADGPCYACRKSAARRRTLLQDLQGREDPCAVKAQTQRDAGIIATTPIMSSIVAALQVEIALRHVLDREDAPQRAGFSCRITIHPAIGLDRFAFERSPNCPLHDAASIMREIAERPDRRSESWSARQLLAETVGDDGVLTLDWPVTARAECRTCGHTWQPMIRRARFRSAQCPSCAGDDLAEIEILTEVDGNSPWAERPLAALGLPLAHVHEVSTSKQAEAPRRHVEVTGDLQGTAEIAAGR